jgi:hypothetical protein
MKYTVTWKPSAEEKLAAIWMTASDREAVVAASGSIDHLLGHRADSVGESRSGSVRILLVPPLAITFEVREDDRMVAVLSVRYRRVGQGRA